MKSAKVRFLFYFSFQQKFWQSSCCKIGARQVEDAQLRYKSLSVHLIANVEAETDSQTALQAIDDE